MDLKTLKIEIQKSIESASDLRQLDVVFRDQLGKQGKLTQVLHSLKDVPPQKRKILGKEANLLKNFLEMKLEERTKEIKEKQRKDQEKKDWVDITAPGKKIFSGHLHPLTLIRRKAVEVFLGMGFSIAEGPELEVEWYNFDTLNFPPNHPAREMQDTFWVVQKDREALPAKKKLLLRTHTSPVQVRYMEKHKPPFRIIAPGKIFRHEATDSSHEMQFHHLEGLIVDKDVSVANFKAIIQEFYEKFFGRSVKVRLRPSYFPFTEPSFEVDMSCVICGGKGCSTCQGNVWLEMMGAGMVNPNVYKYSGLDPKNISGFAFGMGLDRLAMMKYKINDIRLFHSGDMRFLDQF